MLYRSKHNNIPLGSRKSVRTTSKHIDVADPQVADHLPEERGLLLIRLDQRQVRVSSPYLDGKAREPGSGTNVNDMRTRRLGARPRLCPRKQVPGCKYGFAKVASDNFLRLANCGEIDARVPAQE